MTGEKVTSHRFLQLYFHTAYRIKQNKHLVIKILLKLLFLHNFEVYNISSSELSVVTGKIYYIKHNIMIYFI